jgi:hypothetical protein
MIALEIQLNGQRLCLAGAEDLSVLNAGVGVVGLLKSKQSPLIPPPRDSTARQRPYFDLQVGGLTDRGPGIEDSHLRWCTGVNVGIGDVVCVRILDIAPTDADQPTKDRPRGTSISDENEKHLFERSKEIYMALREKYGDGAV